MRRFIDWHKNLLDDIMEWTGFSVYQVMWFAFAKGALLGFFLGKMT